MAEVRPSESTAKYFREVVLVMVIGKRYIGLAVVGVVPLIV